VNGSTIPVALEGCDHGPAMPEGYVGWHNEAERRGAAGWVQTRCHVCELWAVWVKPRPARARPEDDDNPDAIAVRAFAIFVADRFEGGAGTRDQWQELADRFLFGSSA